MGISPEEDARSLELEMTNNDEPACGFWELHPSPLQEQTVLFTTKQSLQRYHSTSSESTKLEENNEIDSQN